MSSVGSRLGRQTLFTRFAAAFPAGSPFNECLVYGQGADGTQLRLFAPQDVLQSISPPSPPSYLAPGGPQTPDDPFATGASYFYCASESSATGETVPNAQGVFGGFLLGSNGAVTASQISIGWLSGSSVGPYHPQNPSATSINLYRATVPPLKAGSAIPQPPPPSDQFNLLASQTITDWNAQPGDLYIDQSTSIGAQTPQVSSYGFSALSTWFDAPLRDFFAYYQTTPFCFYQSNQHGTGSNGTLWTGTVQWVWPETGQPITSRTYIDDKGNARPIGATWQWGDGTQGYLVLQLVGNAYNPENYSDTALAGASGLTAAEYQGAVVNIYFPYFLDNTGLGSVNLPASLTSLPTSNYSLSKAPGWMANASNGPSQMVFGCSGVFATPNDPDAQGQQMPGLAAQALTNLQNVIVSGLNRGVATGYGLALGPQQYTGSYSLSQPLQSQPASGAVPPGTYTYYLSGVLNDGAETALSWGQTITLAAASSVTLAWFPQPPALYKQANIYRQQGSGAIQLVGVVANTDTAPATGFVDRNTPGILPAASGPYPFYPAWNTPAASGYVPSNLYSAFLHQNASADPANGVSINGLVYGYPFDDQGDFSTNINYGTSLPSAITFTISPLS